MRFTPPLIDGVLMERHHRFLAEVQLRDGTIVTAHTANTGSMRGCAQPGSRVWLCHLPVDGRRCPYRWELVEARPGVLVGIDTLKANGLVAEAIANGTIKELQGYVTLRREAVFPGRASRIDLRLSAQGRPDCWVEVKSVTLVEGDTGFFPDAVSKRAVKHLRTLAAAVAGGERGVLVFCLQRADAARAAPASHIDPVYAATLREVADSGVEVLAYRARLSVEEITLADRLPVRFS